MTHGVVTNSIKFNSLQHHRQRIIDAMTFIAEYQKTTVSELLIAMNKDLDKVNEQIKEESK